MCHCLQVRVLPDGSQRNILICVWIYLSPHCWLLMFRIHIFTWCKKQCTEQWNIRSHLWKTIRFNYTRWQLTHSANSPRFSKDDTHERKERNENAIAIPDAYEIRMGKKTVAAAASASIWDFTKNSIHVALSCCMQCHHVSLSFISPVSFARTPPHSLRL